MRAVFRPIALLSLAAALLCSAPALHAQTHTTNISIGSMYVGGTGGAGVLMPYGTVCTYAVSPQGAPLSFTEVGWGLVPARSQFCGNIVSGAVSGGINVPDANHSNLAAPFNYNFVIQRTDASGNALGLPVLINGVSGISGSTWALDAYAPPVSVPTPPPTFGYGIAVPSTCAAPSIWITTAGNANFCASGVYVPLSSGPPGPTGATGAAGANGIASMPQLAGLRVASALQSQTNLYDPTNNVANVTINSANGAATTKAGYYATGLIPANAGGQMVMNVSIPAPITGTADPDQSATANLLNPSDYLPDSLINSSGVVESHGGYNETGYIIVNGLSSVTTNQGVIGGSWPPVFYDSSKTFLSAATWTSCGGGPFSGGNCTNDQTITIPSGAYYMRYGVIGAAGVWPQVQTNSPCSNGVVEAGNSISGCPAFAASGGGSNYTGIAYYDASGSYLSGVDGPLASGTPFTVPTNAAYLRTAFSGDPSNTLMVLNGSTLPSTYVNFGSYARNTVDAKITAATAGLGTTLQGVWPAMRGLEWWLPFTDGSGTTVADVTGNGHSGVIAGGGTAAAWVGPIGLTTNSQTVTLPNAGGGTSLGFCAYDTESSLSYIYGLAVSGASGANLRGGYGPNPNQYNGAHAYYPSIGASNGGNLLETIVGISGVHCVEGIFSNPSHLIVDGVEQAYLHNDDATSPGTIGGFVGPPQTTAPIYIATGSAPIYSAWATNTTETVAQAMARTASELARIKSMGVAVGPVVSQALDSTCSIQGTSIDQGFQASATPASRVTFSPSCTVHDFSISGQGSRDMEATVDTREGSVYHPKAARNIAYHGGVTNSLVNFSEPAALAFQDVLSWNRKAHALGYKTIVSTMMSRTGADTAAQAFNQLLLAAGDEFDWVDNVAAWPQLGATGAYANTTYFADGTHVNDTGQAFYVANEQAAFNGVYGNPVARTVTGSATQLSSDRTIVVNSSSATTLSLLDANTVSFNKAGRLTIKNLGSGTVTVTPVSGETVDSASTYSLTSGNSVVLMPYEANFSSAGANWIHVQP